MVRGSFVFVPKRVVQDPAGFGRHGEALLPADDLEEGVSPLRLEAANLQHVLAFELRQRLAVLGLTMQEFVDTHVGHQGISVDRMQRMLRGETMMTLTDLMLIATVSTKARDRVLEALGEHTDTKERQWLKHENDRLNMELKRAQAAIK